MSKPLATSSEASSVNEPMTAAVGKPATPSPVTVDQIMTVNVFSILPDHTVREAIRLLVTNRVAGAPVIDSARKVMTIVSEGDLLKLAASQGLDRTIYQCMIKLTKTDKLLTVKKTDSFPEVYKKFLAHPVRRFIVVDEMGRLEGIVSRSNVLRVLVDPGQEEDKKSA